MNLQGKIAIVTGAARGIGEAISFKLAAEKANVILCDVDSSVTETAERIKKQTGSENLSFIVNIVNLTEVEEMVKKTIEKFGRIDFLINNAGITRDNLIVRMTEKEWQDVLDVNLKGAFNCIKVVSKEMIKQKYGRIINISSVVGLMGNPGQANYSASKSALLGLTKSLARELASRNILVNAIAPGFIKTRMTESLPEQQKKKLLEMIPLGRFGEPEEVANLVLFLCSDESSYITGQVISINGGMYM